MPNTDAGDASKGAPATASPLPSPRQRVSPGFPIHPGRRAGQRGSAAPAPRCCRARAPCAPPPPPLLRFALLRRSAPELGPPQHLVHPERSQEDIAALADQPPRRGEEHQPDILQRPRLAQGGGRHEPHVVEGTLKQQHQRPADDRVPANGHDYGSGRSRVEVLFDRLSPRRSHPVFNNGRRAPPLHHPSGTFSAPDLGQQSLREGPSRPPHPPRKLRRRWPRSTAPQ
jgi:hypothetical protein